jgi:hypothetical protein
MIQLGVDDTTFAYVAIDSTRYDVANRWVGDANNHQYLRYYSTLGGSTTGFVKWDTRGVAISPILIHFTPSVPNNATIVSARLHMMTIATYGSINDTMSATLMENATDNVWYTSRGVSDGVSDTAALMATASYRYQRQYTGANGYGAASLGEWSPPLSNRVYHWNWGNTTDYTGWGQMNGDGTAKRARYVDITDCVQAIVNGATNNGIAIFCSGYTNANADRTIYGFENRVGQTANNYRPWIEIKYITKRHSSNFPGGKDWAFVFQTDDGRKTANDAYAQTFADHDGKYTIYITKNYIGTANMATPADLANWHSLGNEIGAHSRNHVFASAYQINYWGHGTAANGYAASDTTTYAAGWDSMRTSFNREWLLALGDSLGIGRDNARWGRSMALPGNSWSPWVTTLCAQLGYSTVRCGQMGVNGNLPDAKMGTAFADTARNGSFAMYGRAPRNIMMLPTKMGIEYIVGPKANTTITEADVKRNFRRVVEQAKADNRGIVSLYVHDFKTNPTGAGYAEGLDQEELDWLLDVVDEEGGCYMTASEYGEWMRGGSAAIDTPASAKRDSTAFSSSRLTPVFGSSPTALIAGGFAESGPQAPRPRRLTRQTLAPRRSRWPLDLTT